MRHQVEPFLLAKNNQKALKVIKIAVVCSRFNYQINERLLNGVFACFEDAQINFDKHKDIFYAPGSFEVPLIVKKVIKQNRYDAIICIGTLIKGESDHYKYVCQGLSYAITKLNLKYEIPVIFGFLMVHDLQQALERSEIDFKKSFPYESNLGYDWAKTAINDILEIQTIEKN